MVEEDIVQLVRQMREGDLEARDRLVATVYDRLIRLSRSMLRSGAVAVRRWEQTEDLAHTAWPRIQRALESEDVTVADEAHFFRLAARHIRFELIDLYRKHQGARGLSANHETVHLDHAGGAVSDGDRFQADNTLDPKQLAAWAEFHKTVESLEEEEKALVDLLWYQGLNQQQAADLLSVNVKTVKRRWREIKIRLAKVLDPNLV